VNKIGSSKESEVFGDSEKTLRPLRFARFVPCFNCCRSTTRRCQQKTRNFGFGENQHGSVWECSKGTLLVQVERSTRNCLRCFGAYCRGVSVVCGVVCVFFAKGFVDFASLVTPDNEAVPGFLTTINTRWHGLAFLKKKRTSSNFFVFWQRPVVVERRQFQNGSKRAKRRVGSVSLSLQILLILRCCQICSLQIWLFMSTNIWVLLDSVTPHTSKKVQNWKNKVRAVRSPKESF